MFVGRGTPTLSQAQEDEWEKRGCRGSVIVHEDLTDEDEDEDEFDKEDEEEEEEEEEGSGSVIVKNDPDSEDEEGERQGRKNENEEEESESEEDRRGSVIVHEDDEETAAVWKDPGWRDSSENKTRHVSDDSEDDEEANGSVIVRDDPDGYDDHEDGDEDRVQAEASDVRSPNSGDSAKAPVEEGSIERKGDAGTEGNAWAQKAQRKLKKQVWMKQQKKKRTVKSVLLEEEDFLWKTLDRFEVEKKEVESRRRLRNERRQGVLWLTAPIPDLSEPTTTPTAVPATHTLPINSLKSERTRLVPRPPSPTAIHDEPRYDPLIVMEFPELVRPTSRSIPDADSSRSEAEVTSPSLPAAVTQTIKAPEPKRRGSDSPSIASSPLSIRASSPRPRPDLSPRSSATSSPSSSREGTPRSGPRSRQNSSPQTPIVSIFPLLPPINLPFN